MTPIRFIASLTRDSASLRVRRNSITPHLEPRSNSSTVTAGLTNASLWYFRLAGGPSFRDVAKGWESLFFADEILDLA